MLERTVDLGVPGRNGLAPQRRSPPFAPDRAGRNSGARVPGRSRNAVAPRANSFARFTIAPESEHDVGKSPGASNIGYFPHLATATGSAQSGGDGRPIACTNPVALTFRRCEINAHLNPFHSDEQTSRNGPFVGLRRSVGLRGLGRVGNVLHMMQRARSGDSELDPVRRRIVAPLAMRTEPAKGVARDGPQRRVHAPVHPSGHARRGWHPSDAVQSCSGDRRERERGGASAVRQPDRPPRVPRACGGSCALSPSRATRRSAAVGRRLIDASRTPCLQGIEEGVGVRDGSDGVAAVFDAISTQAMDCRGVLSREFAHRIELCAHPPRTSGWNLGPCIDDALYGASP